MTTPLPMAPRPRIVSASSLGLAITCTASAVLPRVDSTHPRSVMGTAIHAYLENVGRLGRDGALAEVPDKYQAICASIDLSEVPIESMKFAAEVALALDVVTGEAREIGRSIGRDYDRPSRPVAPTELVGTADVIGLSADGTVLYVFDYKTGRSQLAKAEDNWQLRFLAVAGCRVFGAVEARVGLIYVPAADEDEEQPEDVEVEYDRATFDPFEVDAFEGEMRRFYGRLDKARTAVAEGRDPSFTTGDHCRWCSSLAYCRGQGGLIRRYAADPDAVEGELIPVSEEAAARAWMTMRAVDAANKRAKAALMAYASTRPFRLPSGVMVGEVAERGKPAYDARTVRRVLTKFHGAEVADAACEFTTSGEAIKRALRPAVKAAGKKLAPELRTVMGAIDAAGAVTRKPRTVVKEYVPRREALEEIAGLRLAMGWDPQVSSK